MQSPDHLVISFVDDEPWVPAEKFGLPPGGEYRIYAQPEGDDDDFTLLIRYAPGYFEPRHQHDHHHWCVIVDGEMHVDGKILRRGDFLHGPANIPHGPFSYPVGCTIFGSSSGGGGSLLHVFDPADASADPATENGHTDAASPPSV